MNFDDLKANIPEYIKDTRLRLSDLLGGADSTGLDTLEIVVLTVIAVYATRHRKAIQSFRRTFFLLLAGRRQKDMASRRRKYIKR